MLSLIHFQVEINMKKIYKYLKNASNTIRFRILCPVLLIITIVSTFEIYYLYNYAFRSLEEIALDTELQNSLQVKNSIEQFLHTIHKISQKPQNTIEIKSLLKKDYNKYPYSEKSKDAYAIQMFLFREIMLSNTDIESCIIYDSSDDSYTGISNTYILNKDSYYDFHQHDFDFEMLENSSSDIYISNLHENYLLVQPHEDFTVTYASGFNSNVSKTKQLYGAFYINIKSSTFKTLCENSYAKSAGDCYLIDGDQSIIYCNQENLIGSRITEHFPVEDYLLTDRSDSYTDSSNVYTITQPIQGTGWKVLSIAPRNDLLGYKNEVLQLVIISMAILLLIITFTLCVIISSFTRSITHMKNNLQSVSNGDLNIKFETGTGEIGEVNEMIQQMLDNINALIHRIYKEEDEKRKLQIHSLQNQITPHFIYNTLSRLKWMASMQQACTLADAIGSFSDILAYCMKSTNYYISIEEEITFITNYCKIMNLRMINEVQIFFRIPETIKSHKILRFLLQPIVENAFQHAFTHVDHECCLKISAAKTPDSIQFSIEDNGNGIPPEKLAHLLDYSETAESGSIALVNIQNRIHYHYGNAYSLNIHSNPGQGTLITFSIPGDTD